MLDLFVGHAKMLTLVTAILVASKAMTYVYPKALEIGIDVATGLDTRFSLESLTLFLLLVVGVQTLLAYFSNYLRDRLGYRVVLDLRHRVFGQLIRNSIEFHDSHPPAELVARLSGDALSIAEVTVLAALVVGSFLEAIFGLVMMLTIDVRLTLYGLTLLPLIALVAIPLARSLRGHASRVRGYEAKTSAHAQRTLAAIDTVQVFGQYERAERSYVDLTSKAYREMLEMATKEGLVRALTAAGTGFPFLILVWFGGNAIREGRITAGGLAAFLIYLVLVSVGTRLLTEQWALLQRVLGESQVLLALTEQLPATSEEPGPDPPPAPERAERLELQGVTYAYPSEPLHPAIQDVWLGLEVGKTVALVGRSGGGKSTLTKLILRFLKPGWGQITVDGVPASSFAVDQYRSLLGVVQQNPVLFPGTVAENIAYGRATASREEVEAAARRAHVHEFIMQLPAGYDTEVGEEGSKLSGGQRQRIALARALLHEPSFLILDEVTSALDAESEQRIHSALSEIAQTCGVLVIAHRLNTIRSADHICVLEGGRVIEEGDHDTLMRDNKVYRHLAELQMHDAQFDAEVTGLFQSLDDAND